MITAKHFALTTLVMLLVSAATPNAQLPPTPGLTATIGLDATIDKFYRKTHTAIVKTADGMRHMVGITDETAVHGAEAATEPLRGLKEGTHVIVHYVVHGAKNTAVEVDRVGGNGLRIVQGEVVGIDRPARKLIVELPDDSWVTLKLTDRAAHHVGKEVANRSRIVVYYADEGGTQIAHYFRKIE